MTHFATPGTAIADFAQTEILFRSEALADTPDDGFAPTQIVMPEEAAVARPATTPRGIVSARPAPRAPWLGRVEALVDRLLPGGFSSLLGLFLCVSMSIVLISAMLPLVDRGV